MQQRAGALAGALRALVTLCGLCAAASQTALAPSGNVTATDNTTAALGKPRLIAYVNCVCGFGHASVGKDTCGNDPDPTTNYVLEWEKTGKSPITHYILSFLSFQKSQIQSDPGSVWENGGGSTTDFKLQPKLAEAMAAATKNGKKVMLSIGGELGSSAFLDYWASKGATTGNRVNNMRQDIIDMVEAYEYQNRAYGLQVAGIDIDIELGGGYETDGDKYAATRDLINAVPEALLVAFVPQVGNGLCAAPVEADLASGLNPLDALGGQCLGPAASGAPWSLAKLDKDCRNKDGSVKLDWFGIQYYNAVSAVCCGGGGDTAQATLGIAQNYKNLAAGWPGVTQDDMAAESSPWHKWQWWPGPWEAFAGIGADRLVVGKPGCGGCAGSNYFDADSMDGLLAAVSRGLASRGNTKVFGGVLFWDLCRLFGSGGAFCVNSKCQPSWATGSTVAKAMDRLYTSMKAV